MVLGEEYGGGRPFSRGSDPAPDGVHLLPACGRRRAENGKGTGYGNQIWKMDQNQGICTAVRPCPSGGGVLYGPAGGQRGGLALGQAAVWADLSPGPAADAPGGVCTAYRRPGPVPAVLQADLRLFSLLPALRRAGAAGLRPGGAAAPAGTGGAGLAGCGGRGDLRAAAALGQCARQAVGMPWSWGWSPVPAWCC